MSQPTIQYSANDIARGLGQDYLPTDEQRSIIEAELGPLLVVAGAGSGKTETMAARVVWLVANKIVRPEEILGLTFTRKAAGELNERIAQRLRSLAQSGLWQCDEDDGLEQMPTVSTYNAYAGRVVTEHGLRLGVEPDSRMLSQAASWQYAHEIVSGWDEDMSASKVAEATVTNGLMATAGELSEHLRTPQELREYYDELTASISVIPGKSPGTDVKGLLNKVAAHRQLLPLVERYLAMKRERSSIDFSDQVNLAARLAMQFPAVGAIERQRYRMVLLDEFQDTSEAQISFLAALFAQGDDRPGVNAVGDPHQSIFGWRGASASTLNKFARLFASPGQQRTPVASLATSWRNDSTILRAANVVAAPLSRASLVPVKQLAARPAAPEGRVYGASFLTAAEEAAYVASWIKQRRDATSGLKAAVLCRKRSQFVSMIDALEAVGVPAEAVGLGGLLETPEVVDLVSLLWVVDDPSRGDHFMRLLTGPALCLGAADIEALGAWAAEIQKRARAEALEAMTQSVEPEENQPGTSGPGGQPEDSAQAREALARAQADLASDTRDEVSIIEALDELPPADWRGRDGQFLSDAARTRLAGFAVSLARLRALTGLPLADFVSEAERVLGLDIEVQARPHRDPSTARVHLDAFADVAGTFSAQAERPTLGGFLQWLDAAKKEERGLELPSIEVNTDAVQVLTVHAAKGLEWDVVAIPGLNEGVFPSLAGKAKPSDAGGWEYGPHAVKGWFSGLDSIPYALRGDADDLARFEPAGSVDVDELKKRVTDYLEETKTRAEADERRLAYVALTRAKREMLLTCPIWTPGAATPRLPSRYLTELIDAGVVDVDTWADLPEPPTKDEKLTNPLGDDATSAVWPNDPLAEAREALRPGAERVRELTEDARAAEGVLEQAPSMFALPGTREHRDLEVALLLAEQSRAHQPSRVKVPAHLSTSALVSLSQDREAFARALRRPMPTEPATAARRGTQFHAWVEQHFRMSALVDIDELPGFDDDLDAADPEGDPTNDDTFERLKANFLASEWADRTPLDVEVSVETVIAGIAIRGRIDAVFPRPDGGYTIVDWKTGRAPSAATLAHRVLQLGAYAVAYARLRDIPEQMVDGAFFYAATGETLRPQMPSAAEIERLLTDALGPQ